MRRKVWCCVVGGVLGTGLSVGLSADRESASGLSRPAAETPAAPAAYRRNRTASPTERRSYYSELFGQDVDTPVADAAPAQEPAPTETAPEAPADAHTAGRRNTFTLSGHSTPAATPAIQRSADGIIHAEFQRLPGEAERTQIEQVGAGQFEPDPGDPRASREALTQPVMSNRIARPMPASFTGDAPPADVAPLPPESAPTAAPTSAPPTREAPVHPQTRAATGPQETCVSVEWARHGEINVGRECECDLIVTNNGDSDVRNVEVSAFFPKNVRLVSADPRPDSSQDFLAWTLRELEAGESKTIRITMTPLAPGAITTQAEVRCSTAVAGQFEVSEPMLALQLEGPQQVLIGEAATHTIVVSNPGTGVASHVQIEALIPTGLEHARGSQLLMDLGTLHPGETRSIRLPLAAIAGGKHTIQVQARAESDLLQNATADVSVIAPQVAASIDGPSLRYIGRRAAYTVHVQNDGSVATDNVRVMHKVPEGMTFVSAGQGGQYDEATRLLTWFVARLDQGQSLDLSATFGCEQMGSFTHFIRATTEQGSVSDSQFTTNVEGASSLALDIQDLEDPIEVGSQTAYEIRVTNEGSAPAKNVAVSCELPAEMSLVDIESPVQFAAERGTVVFQPIAQIKPGETVTIRVDVKCAAAGNHRFRASLSSESIDEPLVGDELTKFYGE